MSWGSVWTTYYKLQGDTIINNKPYKVIYSSSRDSLMQYWKKETNFFIRDDSFKKVYKYQLGEEQLIYDFSLQLGDSIDVGRRGFYAKVISTDSISINGQYRKRIIFDPWFNEFWIEGIGSSSKPFNPFANKFASDISFELLCVKDNDTLLYKNPIHDNCYWDFIDGVHEIDNQKDYKIIIYPMPIHTSATIINDNTSKSWTAKIINNLGQVIANYFVRDNSFIFSTEGINPGVYFLIVISDNRIITNKIIIEK